MTRQKMIQSYHFLLLLPLSLLSCAQIAAQEIEIVFPMGYADVEGPDGFPGGDTFLPSRSQTVFRADQFALQLPETHQYLIGFRWRPDRSMMTQGSSSVDNIIIKASTTDKDPAYLSARLSDNLGEDVTTVYEGPLTVSTMNAGPPEGPKDFDQEFLFQTPFKYDPSLGNLLIETSWFSPYGSLGVDECCYQGEQFSQWIDTEANNPLGNTGVRGGRSSTIVQFIFVPEPSSILLCSFGLCGLLALRRRR